MIATEPVRPCGGDAATVRGHGAAVLRGLGFPPSRAPGLLAEAINPVGEDPFSPGLNAGMRMLLGAVRTRAPEEAEAAGLLLTGLGGGSTPLGDDYLLGVMLGVRAMGAAAGFSDPAREAWLSALAPADVNQRTSPTSAALLAAAFRGRAPRVLHGILDPGGPSLASALGEVTAVGATSGRGCAAAIGAAALLLSDASAPRSRRRPTGTTLGGKTPA